MPRSGAWWLSERLYWKKIRVKCECGVKRQYDAQALFHRIGDRSMPALLGEISAAIGCEKSANVYRDRCKLTYEMPLGELAASRRSRLVMRPQPAPLTRSHSRIFPNGATFFASAGDYFRGKNGNEASIAGIRQAASVRNAYDKLLQREAEGREPPKNSIVVPMMEVYNACTGMTLTGDPESDWTTIRGLLEGGACSRLREIGDETRNVRLLGRGSQVRQALSQDWRSNGKYRNALASYRAKCIRPGAFL